VTKEETKSVPLRARETAKRLLRHDNAVLIIVLIALIGVMSAVTHGLTSSRVNMMNVLLQSSIRGVAAVGQAFVILTAGIDLSVGGVGLVCSMLGATLMTNDPTQSLIGYPVPLASGILIMLLAGLGWGAVNGSLVSRIGMPALIVTLGMWEITKGVGFQVNAGQYVMGLPESLSFMGEGRIAGVPVLVIIFIAVAAVGYFVLSYTTFGKSVYATGGHLPTAWLSGIKVRNILFSVYAISGFLAGLTGVMLTARTMSASMLASEGLELDSIASVVVGGVSLFGGRGSIIGVVVGALIIGVINNALSVLGANPAMVRIIKGVIIFTAVAVDFLRKR
jgi:putative xylitol transport system permease protein